MTLPLCSAGATTWGESGAGGNLCEVEWAAGTKEVELGAPGEAWESGTQGVRRK